ELRAGFINPFDSGDQRLFGQLANVFVVLNAQEVDKHRLQALYPVPLQTVQVVSDGMKSVLLSNGGQSISKALLMPDAVSVLDVSPQHRIVGIVEDPRLLFPGQGFHHGDPAMEFIKTKTAL